MRLLLDLRIKPVSNVQKGALIRTPKILLRAPVLIGLAGSLVESGARVLTLDGAGRWSVRAIESMEVQLPKSVAFLKTVFFGHDLKNHIVQVNTRLRKPCNVA